MKGFQNHTSKSHTSDVLQRRDLKQRDSLPWDIDIAVRRRERASEARVERGVRGLFLRDIIQTCLQKNGVSPRFHQRIEAAIVHIDTLWS